MQWRIRLSGGLVWFGLAKRGGRGVVPYIGVVHRELYLAEGARILGGYDD